MMPARHHRPAAGRLITVRRTGFLLLSGLVLAAPIAGSAQTQTAPIARPSVVDPYAGFITEAARRFGVPEAWIRAVMRVESRGDTRAISKAGAMGLMQIMPATWAEMRARYGLGSDPYDPRDNILAGAAFLREMHDRYGSPGFLAAYNAGPGRYEEYRTTGRPLPAETRAYVAILAPIIGGGDLTAPATGLAADPLAWTRAPIFIAQAGSDATADRRQTDSPSTAAPPSTSPRDPEQTDPQASALFVVRGGDGGPK
jgi:soluble lytic murein transglycosylase-like protein